MPIYNRRLSTELRVIGGIEYTLHRTSYKGEELTYTQKRHLLRHGRYIYHLHTDEVYTTHMAINGHVCGLNALLTNTGKVIRVMLEYNDELHGACKGANMLNKDGTEYGVNEARIYP